MSQVMLSSRSVQLVKYEQFGAARCAAPRHGQRHRTPAAASRETRHSRPKTADHLSVPSARLPCATRPPPATIGPRFRLLAGDVGRSGPDRSSCRTASHDDRSDIAGSAHSLVRPGGEKSMRSGHSPPPPSKSGERSLPSSGLSPISGTPAKLASVGSKSMAPAICGTATPGLILAGQRMKNGTRTPPSSVEALSPFMPPFHRHVAGPFRKNRPRWCCRPA